MDEQNPIIDTHIPIAPVAKGRPRATIRNGKVHVYSPKNSAEFERLIKQFTRWRVKKPNLTDDLMVKVIFHVKGRVADIDNYQKSLFDGCNGTVWKDDAQVVEVHAFTRRKAKEPGIDLYVAVAAKPEEEVVTKKK